MIDLSAKRTRYLKDSVQIRLGGIAANLSRVNTFSNNSKHSVVVSNLLNESRYFIEWTTKEADLETQIKLVEIQLQMSLWIQKWDDVWNNQSTRTQMAEESKKWSDQILKISGFM